MVLGTLGLPTTAIGILLYALIYSVIPRGWDSHGFIPPITIALFFIVQWQLVAWWVLNSWRLKKNRMLRITPPNQLPDPTSPSVTPAAGAAGAPSVAADH